MKTLKEWMGDQGEDPAFSLVQEQASMMVTRFAGLLNGLPDDQRAVIVKQIVAKLSGMTGK